MLSATGSFEISGASRCEDIVIAPLPGSGVGRGRGRGRRPLVTDVEHDRAGRSVAHVGDERRSPAGGGRGGGRPDPRRLSRRLLRPLLRGTIDGRSWTWQLLRAEIATSRARPDRWTDRRGRCPTLERTPPRIGTWDFRKPGRSRAGDLRQDVRDVAFGEGLGASREAGSDPWLDSDPPQPHTRRTPCPRTRSATSSAACHRRRSTGC